MQNIQRITKMQWNTEMTNQIYIGRGETNKKQKHGIRIYQKIRNKTTLDIKTTPKLAFKNTKLNSKTKKYSKQLIYKLIHPQIVEIAQIT